MCLLWAYVGRASSISVLHLDKVDKQNFRDRFLIFYSCLYILCQEICPGVCFFIMDWQVGG